MLELTLSENRAGQSASALVQFVLPPELEAREPAELRGLRRDAVRLMVLPHASGEPIHTRFDALGEFLRAGDLLVVNDSRTLPALLRARDENGEPIEVRLAHRRAEDLWDALLLNGRTHIGRVGMRLDFGNDLHARILARRPDLPFLWRMKFDVCCSSLLDLIYRLGEPVRYTYVPDALPLDLYQTVYANSPGSVEMPSAGRPLTWELLLKLKRNGVGLASISLHTGLSSTRDDAVDARHPNYDEEFHVPATTAQAVNETRARGGRVLAVGTTVVRALETAARADDTLAETRGWTQLRIHQNYRLRLVDGLLTGLHEPQASHLDLLSAFVEPTRLQAAYQACIARGYLWHEFGDMNLIV
ncbi:MAG: S-adenosylmethionine:tRNA ribosyltransferase-isomerase [Chloroflexi bacterium]|nr:S-adenosylmethionine:tRNA ribosyltransferase-isomerase [Chloroflexota bacterium]